MRTGEHLPDDQAELVFADAVVDWLAEHLGPADRERVFDDIVSLFRQPWGKHPLSNRGAKDRLAGLNTLSTLDGEHRVVFRVTVSPAGVGLIEILAVGRRRGNAVYDAVNAMIATGLLDDVATQVWDLLRVYEDVVERVGLELWDYAPEPAPAGIARAAVAAGVLDAELAALLSTDEITAAMAGAWDPETGQPDRQRALDAALERVRGSSTPERVLGSRGEPRCAAWMPRTQAPCIRRRGHPGAHRATS